MWDGIEDKQEEPYKMTLFGKSTGRLEIMAADFLPGPDQLFIVLADADCNLHVMQYDPERELFLIVHSSLSVADLLLNPPPTFSLSLFPYT